MRAFLRFRSVFYALKFPMLRSCLVISAFCLVCGTTKAAFYENIPLPRGLFKADVVPQSRDVLMEALLGIPYRADGAIDASGRYTMFAEQSRFFDSPGLNCSGLVVEAARLLLRKNFSLDEVKRDRLSDSGPGSPHGEDWDFGWDLIMNISEGYRRKLLLPGGKSIDPAGGNGFAPRGYDIQEPKTWSELPARLKSGNLYLVSLNVGGRRKGYGLQHYHVGIIYMASGGEAWFYQTTGKGETSNRRDLKSAAGQASFKRAFANSGGKRKMMLVIEVPLL